MKLAPYLYTLNTTINQQQQQNQKHLLLQNGGQYRHAKQYNFPVFCTEIPWKYRNIVCTLKNTGFYLFGKKKGK